MVRQNNSTFYFLVLKWYERNSSEFFNCGTRVIFLVVHWYNTRNIFLKNSNPKNQTYGTTKNSGTIFFKHRFSKKIKIIIFHVNI